MTPAGIEPATFRFVAQHLNHCATAVSKIIVGFENIQYEMCYKDSNYSSDIYIYIYMYIYIYVYIYIYNIYIVALVKLVNL